MASEGDPFGTPQCGAKGYSYGPVKRGWFVSWKVYEHVVYLWILPSRYVNSLLLKMHFLMGKSAISMAMASIAMLNNGDVRGIYLDIE
jgi:hypothetical protein